MTGGEAQAAWRLFAINWRLLTLLALVLAVSFAISGFSFGLGGALVSYGFVALYGAFAYYNAKAAHRRDPQVVYVLGCTGQSSLPPVSWRRCPMWRRQRICRCRTPTFTLSTGRSGSTGRPMSRSSALARFWPA